MKTPKMVGWFPLVFSFFLLNLFNIWKLKKKHFNRLFPLQLKVGNCVSIFFPSISVQTRPWGKVSTFSYCRIGAINREKNGGVSAAATSSRRHLLVVLLSNSYWVGWAAVCGLKSAAIGRQVPVKMPKPKCSSILPSTNTEWEWDESFLYFLPCQFTPPNK